jgi:transposase InsO family protein
VRFRFIAAEKAEYPVTLISRILQVSTSGFYAWSKRLESARSRSDRALVLDIKAVHKASRGTYGSPRVHRELVAQQHLVGRDRVARLMRENDVRGRRKRRFRTTTQSNHSHPVAPNVLERQFAVEQPNVAWVGDITYVWTLEGWLYLSVILDLYSRRVVGWAMGERIDQALTLRAMDMALKACEPNPGLIHHSDRGSQYAANDYRKLLRARRITCSMSRKGNCWDNAVAESFFSSLKKERIKKQIYKNRELAIADVADYIDTFYNRTRRHSHLGGLSPEQFEATHKVRRQRLH